MAAKQEQNSWLEIPLRLKIAPVSATSPAVMEPFSAAVAFMPKQMEISIDSPTHHEPKTAEEKSAPTKPTSGRKKNAVLRQNFAGVTKQSRKPSKNKKLPPAEKSHPRAARSLKDAKYITGASAEEMKPPQMRMCEAIRCLWGDEPIAFIKQESFLPRKNVRGMGGYQSVTVQTSSEWSEPLLQALLEIATKTHAAKSERPIGYVVMADYIGPALKARRERDGVDRAAVEYGMMAEDVVKACEVWCEENGSKDS